MISKEMPPYKIYYAVIPANKIYNALEPDRVNGEGHMDELNAQNGFFTKIEESILKDGIVNPILVSLGWVLPKVYETLPEEIQQSLDKTLICLTKGGSRLWVAQKHNLDVPCIISDYVGTYKDQQDLDAVGIISYFGQPGGAVVKYGSRGLLIKNLQHIHLK